MFVLAALPEDSPVAPTATVKATPFSPGQPIVYINPSHMPLSLHFDRGAACIFNNLRTLLPTRFSVSSVFSAPCALFGALFFELALCFQHVAHSLVRSFAPVRTLSQAISCGCAL